GTDRRQRENPSQSRGGSGRMMAMRLSKLRRRFAGQHLLVPSRKLDLVARREADRLNVRRRAAGQFGERRAAEFAGVSFVGGVYEDVVGERGDVVGGHDRLPWDRLALRK